MWQLTATVKAVSPIPNKNQCCNNLEEEELQEIKNTWRNGNDNICGNVKIKM